MHEPCKIYSGSGSPEHQITAPAGSFYLDASTGTIYHKTWGGDASGWIAISWNGSVSAGASQGPEVPTGAVDGVNRNYTLANVPNPASSVWGFLNNGGIFQDDDFTVNGNVVTMTEAPSGGNTVRFFYRY